MKHKKYKHSFARRLTRWVMAVLFVMMSALGYLVYHMAEEFIVESSASMFHSNMKSSGKIICDALSDVSVAVRNNVFDIEQHVDQPAQLQAIMERIVANNPRIRSCGVSFIENYFPQIGRTYCPYVCRQDSLPQKATIGNYLEAEWFVEAVAKDSVYWSAPFFDSRDTKSALVAYLYPIHDRKGRVVAILGADLSLDFMTQLLQQQDSIFQKEAVTFNLTKDGFFNSYVIDKRHGQYITHPDYWHILKGSFFVHIKDADTPGLAQELKEDMADDNVSEDETDKVVLVNRLKSYIFYVPLEGTNWCLALSMPVTALNVFGIIAGFIMLMIITFILMVTFFVSRLAIVRAASPLKQLAATADKVAMGQFDTPLPTIKSGDEIHLLRDSFENMQHSLTSYIKELKEATATKASIESELKIAHDIQMSMLPKTYPAFPNRHDLDIYGQVMPAKAVGGDLYDFFINDDKLFFCIGDVSGKGVPASLVMAVTRSLFRNISAYTQEPNHIAIALNNALSSNNDTGMFVTIFIGVLNLSNGHLTFSNAGHNPPLLLTKGGVSILSCDANIPAGVASDWEFTQQAIQMKTDESLFLYTDGLNEAEDSRCQQFGMENIVSIAKRTVNQPQPLIEAMTTAVQLFVGDAEQSDDLTMLAIQYTNPITSSNTPSDHAIQPEH